MNSDSRMNSLKGTTKSSY